MVKITKTKVFLLQKRLNGHNFIVEFDDSEISGARIQDGDSVIHFHEFLKKYSLDQYNAVIELAQVLKIPYKQFLELVEADEENGKGYITVDVSKNIVAYLNNRLNFRQIYFLHGQCGEAGTANKPDDFYLY